MTKAELIGHLANKCDVSKVTVEKVFETFVEQVTKTLVSEGRFAIGGFGILEVVHREARTARNPRTNEAIEIDAQNTVKFKIAKALKQDIND